MKKEHKSMNVDEEEMDEGRIVRCVHDERSFKEGVRGRVREGSQLSFNGGEGLGSEGR